MKRSIVSTALLFAACFGGSGEKIDVAVSLPAGATSSDISGLHAWVVSGEAASCNLLVAGAQEPYDVGLTLLGEGGARMGEALSATVTKRDGVVYVVAFDFEKNPLYAGCTSVSNAESVSVTLGRLQVYDCADSNTPQGARCDDDNRCTLNERCRSGSCTGGTPRSCATLNGPCSNGTCDPALGCQKVNANEGLTCDDGLFCTGSGICRSGTCAADPITCPAPPGQCLQAGVCSEQYDRCIYLPKPRLTSCDDGNACQTGDYCDYYGNCTAGTANVTATNVECDGNPCTQGDSCTSGSCVTGSTYAAAGTPCDDNNPCTVNTTCYGPTWAMCTNGTSAAAGTSCWISSHCYVGDQCSGSSCTNGSYVTDFDGDGCERPGCDSWPYCEDCNDNDPTIHEGAIERCGDGKDNNCDDRIDEVGCSP